jgi:hypothetical protein
MKYQVPSIGHQDTYSQIHCFKTLQESTNQSHWLRRYSAFEEIFLNFHLFDIVFLVYDIAIMNFCSNSYHSNQASYHTHYKRLNGTISLCPPPPPEVFLNVNSYAYHGNRHHISVTSVGAYMVKIVHSLGDLAAKVLLPDYHLELLTYIGSLIQHTKRTFDHINRLLSCKIRSLTCKITTLSCKLRPLTYKITTLTHKIRPLIYVIRPLDRKIRLLIYVITTLTYFVRAVSSVLTHLLQERITVSSGLQRTCYRRFTSLFDINAVNCGLKGVRL